MNPLLMRPQGMPPMGSTLPPIPSPMAGGSPNPSAGTLPPIPGYTPGMPTNPLGGEHLFYQNTNDQGQTVGGSLANPGTYVAPTVGNPLYYGRTGAYTGYGGPTDTGAPPKPTIGAVTDPAPASGITFRDALEFMYGPGDLYGDNRDIFLGNLMGNDAFRQDIESKWGASLSDPYSRDSDFWKTLQTHLGKIGTGWQGRGDNSNGGVGAGQAAGTGSEMGGSDV